MKKDNLVELKEIKEEKFYQQKQAMVDRLDDFIYRNLPQSDYILLESKFNKKTKHIFKRAGQRGLFHFWLYFFHRYDNGLRGLNGLYQR